MEYAEELIEEEKKFDWFLIPLRKIYRRLFIEKEIQISGGELTFDLEILDDDGDEITNEGLNSLNKSSRE